MNRPPNRLRNPPTRQAVERTARAAHVTSRRKRGGEQWPRTKIVTRVPPTCSVVQPSCCAPISGAPPRMNGSKTTPHTGKRNRPQRRQRVRVRPAGHRRERGARRTCFSDGRSCRRRIGSPVPRRRREGGMGIRQHVGPARACRRNACGTVPKGRRIGPRCMREAGRDAAA